MIMQRVLMEERADRAFMFDSPFGYLQLQQDRLQEKADEMKRIIERNMPAGNERDQALLNLEQALYWFEIGTGKSN